MIPKNAQSFLNVIHLLSKPQIMNQHAILMVELDEQGYKEGSEVVTAVNDAAMNKLYPEIQTK